ncbi:PREDICTED: inactive protein RESTRICTED TEV MOVEMENT 2-like [Nelumbo nucifera]|uniref:Inactive protein RESTRICTED TEV MOVEMENT 2-like n=2 Tax=Nelumbo nucifera TaxID=4432 RepID=A0A1U7Z7G5_NELNU|nr:PREDICTED: inactive protein RESTRICTED TEV MOVEMENT 2-like [Nelumbo nucifera]DAD29390.1 TPA_asm: hypothetical protein HUJ06_030858 [Nelumbo nucifera]
MDKRARVYEDFQPTMEWKKEAESDVLHVRLPGFKKDHIRVQLAGSKTLTISGEHPLRDNRWIRFQKEFNLAENCRTRGIQARFAAEVLTIVMPKTVAPAHPEPEVEPKPDIQADDKGMKENGRLIDANNVGQKASEKKEEEKGDDKFVDARKASDEEKEEEQEKEAINGEARTLDGATENVITGAGGRVMGLCESRILNMVAAVMAVMAFVVYLISKLGSSGKPEAEN